MNILDHPIIINFDMYDESFYNDRDIAWSLTLFAEEDSPNPAMQDLLWNDMIKIGLGNSLSNGFVYGEDEYDIPPPPAGQNTWSMSINLSASSREILSTPDIPNGEYL